ncbi:sigma-70 family RNA polymerase sigma factor [Puteibacter caeruleilacunae]|nr:sigma-70 family RNA polymerase sigma factor [Puteibacter caeruleilacunae]
MEGGATNIERNDSEQWKALKRGDKNALSVLFNNYYQFLFNYGYQMIQDRDLVKDAIQELFYSIWSRRERLGDVVYVKSYLLMSLRRQLLLLKQLEKSSDVDSYSDEEAEMFVFEEEQFMDNEEISSILKQQLISTINQLTTKQRELVFLRFYQELSYKQIAELLSINEQSVKNNMQRIIKKMREWITFQDGEYQVDNLLFALFVYYKRK